MLRDQITRSRTTKPKRRDPDMLVFSAGLILGNWCQPQSMSTERQRAISFSRGCKNGIGHGRDQCYWTNFASPTETHGTAVNYVHLDRRRFIHLGDLIVMKICFYSATVLKSDVRLERNAEPPNSTTLN